MLSKKQRQRELSCAEDISLLSILNPPSYAPLVNKPPFLRSQPDSSRVLPFEAEVSLASTLAFLSGISDDPNHVVAVCVEELVDQTGLFVRVAINKDDSGSGDTVLKSIKDGLQRIFKCLSRVASDQEKQVQEQVLTAILNMSQYRLLCRLGVQRAGVQNTRDKSFFGSPIQQIIDAVAQHSFPKKHQEEVKIFINLARTLVSLLEKLKTCNISSLTGCLRRVVRASSQLRDGTNFDRLFSPLDILPTTKTGFVTRLSKIARYYESSQFLVELARRSKLFPCTDVTTITLDPETFLRVPNTETIHKLSECLSRCYPGTSSPLNLHTICRKVKTDPTTAEAVFKKATKKILVESKVHAEVQIVAYYELHPVPRRPRVICSNKDACYLCSLFIQVHGMYYVPKSHGRLYPGWRVPPIPALTDTHAQLDKALQKQIRDVIQEFKDFPARERVIDLNQNESTIFPFSTLMASLNGIAPPVVETLQAGPVQKPQRQAGEPQEQTPLLRPEQPPVTSPATSRPCKSNIAQRATHPSKVETKGYLIQQLTFKSISATSKPSLTPVFSPISAVSHQKAVQSSPTPFGSPIQPTGPIPAAIKPTSIPDGRAPALPNHPGQPVGQIKEPSIMKPSKSVKKPSRSILPPLRPEPQIIRSPKPPVEKTRFSTTISPKPKHSPPPQLNLVEPPRDLTVRNLALWNQSQDFPPQLENQKLTEPPSQLAEVSPLESLPSDTNAANQRTPLHTQNCEACHTVPYYKHIHACASGTAEPAGKGDQAPAGTLFLSLGGRTEAEQEGKIKGKVWLQRGKTARVWMDGRSGGMVPPVYTTGRLDIYLDFVFEGNKGEGVVGVGVTWLGGQGLKGGRGLGGRNYHCLERLERGVEVDGGSRERVILEGGREVVVVEVVRGGRGR